MEEPKKLASMAAAFYVQCVEDSLPKDVAQYLASMYLGQLMSQGKEPWQ